MSTAGTGFSPLDAELGLLPNHRFTPRVAELLARLGGAVPFAEARDLLRLVLGVRVSEATLRQRTYSAGRAALAVEEAALAGALRSPGRADQPPAVLQLSLDATKVPLVGGAWTDVKLAAFAELAPDGAATKLSYVARWAPAERFGETITLEAQRRGLDAAGAVASPNDGAAWIQGNLDLVAHRAVRILDFPRAAEHLGVVAGLVHGAGAAEAHAWAAARRPPVAAPRPKLVVNGRPAAAHPWRAFRFGAALRPGGLAAKNPPPTLPFTSD